jgi:hypothetical protein
VEKQDQLRNKIKKAIYGWHPSHGDGTFGIYLRKIGFRYSQQGKQLQRARKWGFDWYTGIESNICSSSSN